MVEKCVNKLIRLGIAIPEDVRSLLGWDSPPPPVVEAVKPVEVEKPKTTKKKKSWLRKKKDD